MRQLLVIIVVVFSLSAFGQDLVILHTNDMHSHVNGFSPEAEYTPLVDDNDPTLGGFSRIAGFIKSEKEVHGDKVLVVDGGDFLMGTLFQTLELTEGFQMNLMRKMGYEYATLGNHEFDFGPDRLAQIIKNNQEQGDIMQLLCTNYKGATLSDDSELQKLFDDGSILPYSITVKNGLKIGLFGMIGIDAHQSIPSFYGIELEKQKKVAKKTAKFLKKQQQVDLVIMLSHSGVVKDKKGNWKGEDVDMAKAAPEIDVIISGHTHTYLPQVIKAGNACIVQTGAAGLYVGRLEVRMDAFGDPLVQYSLVPMDDKITADAEIQQMIDEKVPTIEKDFLSNVGVGYNQPLFETDYDLVLTRGEPLNSNLGPFVADALYYQMNKEGAPGADIVMAASGTIRTNIMKGNKGKQNINDIFNIMPLGASEDGSPGSPLGKIHVTAYEFKRVMELILYKIQSKPHYYLFVSGVQVDYNPNKGLFKKISAIRITRKDDTYRPLDIGKKSKELISVAANNYLIGFFEQIKQMSFGLVKVTPKDAEGNPMGDRSTLVDLDPYAEGVQEAKEWLSIYEMVKSFDDTDGNGIPNVPEEYVSKRSPMIVVE